MPDGVGGRASDCAMTNREARPHLVKSCKGMQPPAFNGYVYAYRDKYDKEGTRSYSGRERGTST